MTERRTPDGDPDAEEARRLVELQRSLGRRAAEEAAALERELRETRVLLRETRNRLRALEGRRSVRLAIEVGDRLRVIRRRVRQAASGRAAGGRGGAARPGASAGDERALMERLRPQIGGPAPATGERVSMIMLNRDGEAHLRRCLPALAATAYRDLELIVIDNGSSDGSMAVLEAFRPSFPVRIVPNVENLSFSDGNNQGAELATGSLLLFINNDIEPISADWLGHMVETMAAGAGDIGAVGARLIYPRRPGVPRAGARHADLSLQHGGVGFAMRDGVPIAVPLGAGDDPTTDWAAAVRDCPALTAACLLVRRTDFEAVGGFTTGYDYGQEDVDLCLKLADRGRRRVYDGRAALWHHESATRVALDGMDVRRARVAANLERFVDRWAVRLYRTAMVDALACREAWRSPLRVAVIAPAGDAPQAAGRETAASANGLATSLAAAGFDVLRVDAAPGLEPALPAGPDVDIAVAMDAGIDLRALPASVVRAAWIGGPSEASSVGTGDYDVIVRPDGGDPAGAFRAAVGAWLGAPRITIRIPPPSWDAAPRWGDTHFGQGLQAAFGALGWPARLALRPEWTSWACARSDVVVDLLGLHEAPVRPGRRHVLWQISHPELARPDLYARYDLVFVASASFARHMAALVDVPVVPLSQATDPNRFRPEPTGPAHEILFVAGWRRPGRHVVDDVLPTDHDLAVYGHGWTTERLPARYLAGTTIPNDELGGYYAAADIVLNDHWLAMRREGFLSNRLYDASAAGAFVITDEIEGLDAEFDGGIVAYRDRGHLRELVEHYLAHPDERRAMAERARNAVLARHTFVHRARTILDALAPLAPFQPPIRGDGSAPPSGGEPSSSGEPEPPSGREPAPTTGEQRPRPGEPSPPATEPARPASR
jgi:GT2 family glycosyltransferase